MANNCDNYIVFYTDRKNLPLLKELHKTILDILPKANDIAKLLTKLLPDDKEILKFVDGRDYIGYCEDDICIIDELNKDCNVKYRYHFNIQVISAWSENMRPFYELLERKYDNKIKVAFKSEQPGDEYYVKSADNDGFISDRYIMNYYIATDEDIEGKRGLVSDACEYLETFEEVLKWVQVCFSKANVTEKDTIDEMREKVREVYLTDDDYYFELYEFEEVDKEELYNDEF